MTRLYLWLETILSFLYFLGVSPFKFHYNFQRGKYTLVTSSCKKALTAIIHTCAVLVSFFGIYTSTSALSLKNPRCIFHVAVTFSRFVICYSLLFTFWTRRPHFEKFFISSYSTNFLSPKFKGFSDSAADSNTKVKCLAWFFCFSMIPAAIVIELLNYSGISFYQYIHSTFAKPAGVQHFEKIFGFQGQLEPPSPFPLSPLAPNLSMSANLPPPPPHMSTFEFVATTIFDIVQIYLRVGNHVAVLFCIFAGITLHQATKRFSDSVSRERNQDKVILLYIDFCRFGTCLNNMCGCMVLGTVVCSPPFFIVYFIGTFTSFEYIGPRIVFYSVLYSCLYIIAAEASAKIGEFKEWIIEYGQEENESQLFAMFVEISQNPMGLRGMGCFTITYGFLSKMFGMIITFTIILLQFETTPGNSITNIPCR